VIPQVAQVGPTWGVIEGHDSAAGPTDRTGDLPIADLRHHLAAARARRAVQDLERSLQILQAAIGALGTLRGFSDAEFTGHATVSGLAATVRAARASLPSARGASPLDLKTSPAPEEFHRWLEHGDPR